MWPRMKLKVERYCDQQAKTRYYDEERVYDGLCIILSISHYIQDEKVDSQKRD